MVMTLRPSQRKLQRRINRPTPLHMCISCAHASLGDTELRCRVHRDSISLTEYCQYFSVWRDSALRYYDDYGEYDG